MTIKKFFLFSFLSVSVSAEQFVSLNLCSDRLLIEFARPEQIAAMSPYSQKTLMMLDKSNQDKPIVEPQLLDLLPYRDKTILLNTTFYPQLVEQLTAYGFKIYPLNDNPQTKEELFTQLRALGEKFNNQDYVELRISALQAQSFKLDFPQNQTLILAETGMTYTHLPQYQTLLELLDLQPLQSDLNEQNFSLEKMLLANPDILITLADRQGYNERAELLSHPLLQKIFAKRPLATMPLKYTYCFDHGVWQGADLIWQQLNKR